MDKPVSLSVKNFLIRKMAVTLIVPEKTIQAVVDHQFNMAIEAMDRVKSVEISGFGKFIYNEKRGKRIVEKCEMMKKRYEDELAQGVTENRKKVIDTKLTVVLETIKALKPKLHED